MGDWPTSGTRGQSSQRNSGYQGNGSATGGAYPLTEQAMRNTPSPSERAGRDALGRALGREQMKQASDRYARERFKPFGKRPPGQPAPISQSAAGGLSRAGKLMWPVRAGKGLYDLGRFLLPQQGKVNSLGDWEMTLDCGNPKTHGPYTNMVSYTCGAQLAVFQEQQQSATFDPSKSTAGYFQHTGDYWPYPPPTQRWVSAGYMTKKPGGTVPPHVKPAVQFERGIGEGTGGEPDQSPEDGMAPYLDPMSAAPGGAQLPPWVPPFRMLPQRGMNPERSPEEQTHRGYAQPGQAPAPKPQPKPSTVRPPKPYEPDWAWPGTDPAPQPQPQPAPAPGSGGVPMTPGDDLPGWVAEPGTGPRPRPQPFPEVDTVPTPKPPPVTIENPPNAAGPTLVVGSNGTPVGPHERRPPDAGTKERKGRIAAGVVLRFMTKGKKAADAVMEAGDVLDCIYGALPKARRWEVQKADWAKQRAAGAKPRPKDTLNTREGLKVDLGPAGLEGESVTIPGGVAVGNPRYADPRANYIQPLSPQDKAAAVWKYSAEVDLDAFTKCMLSNEAEDNVIGQQSQVAEDAAKKAGKLVGYETGPTF